MYRPFFDRLQRYVWPLSGVVLIVALLLLAPAMASTPPTPRTPGRNAASVSAPTPGTSGWTQFSSAAFGYALRYPTAWTVRDNGAADNTTIQLLTFRVPGAVADVARLQVSRRPYADTLDLVRHELNDRPLTPITIGGRPAAIGTGPAYDGGIMHVAVIPTAHATLLLALHASDEADPNVDAFSQLLATLEVSDSSRVFLPLIRH